MEKNIKKMKKEIADYFSAVPDKQIYLGQFLNKIGNKNVYILNCWGKTTIQKVGIKEFYKNYVEGR